ncbi:MAG TPA: hypothetical protein GXZ76_06235 [Clostridiaceae bacterium]|nr:hypothetical protein [Clostridiaceae bacterium]
MKKLITFLIVLTCILSFSITVLATDSEGNSEFVVLESSLNHDTYENIVALYEHWETNGYPDYVGFVYSTDGSTNNLTVLLVADDGTAEDQIRSMLISDSGLSFGSAKYSYNELMAISKEISSEYLENNKLFYGLGVGWGGVGDGEPGFGDSGREARVVVEVDSSIFAEYTKLFKELYGDKVVVFDSEAFVDESDIAEAKNTSLLWLLIPVMLLVGVGIIFAIRTKLVPALQTATGSVVTKTAPISRKQTIEAVKNSEVSPRAEVFDSILSKIEKEDIE